MYKAVVVRLKAIPLCTRILNSTNRVTKETFEIGPDAVSKSV